MLVGAATTITPGVRFAGSVLSSTSPNAKQLSKNVWSLVAALSMRKKGAGCVAQLSNSQQPGPISHPPSMTVGIIAPSTVPEAYGAG